MLQVRYLIPQIYPIFRNKNNPILIREPDVSKTSITKGLMYKVVNCAVPESLIACLYSLDMGASVKYEG